MSRRAIIALLMGTPQPAPVFLGWTISDIAPSTGDIPLVGGGGTDITITITATTSEAAGIVYASDGVSPLGAIAGSVGDTFVISVPLPAGDTTIRVDWASGSPGSLSFTLA